MRLARRILWGLVALALAALAILLVAPVPQRPGEPVTAGSFGGPFTLTGADGRTFSSARLNGRPHAIFFGFTNCPDICPTTLARLVRLRHQAGGDSPFEIVFVTVDPERDGPAEVGKYAELFESPVIGLTGSPAQIDKVKKQYGIFSQKVQQGGSYTVDHSAALLLFDRDGRFKATISDDEGDGPVLDKLKQLTA